MKAAIQFDADTESYDSETDSESDSGYICIFVYTTDNEGAIRFFF